LSDYVSTPSISVPHDHVQLHFIDVLDNVNRDLSDSEFIEQDDGLERQTPGGHSEPGDAGTPGGGDGDESGEGGEDGEVDGDIDEELAAELDRELEGEDDDEDEDDETQQARQLLNEEITDLEFAVRKKEAEVASTGNPLIRKCFEDALKKLRADLEVKMGQKDEMIEMARLRKPGDDAEGDDGQDAGEDVADREEAGPLPRCLALSH
jgi:transcription initiation factor TFIID subunit 7